MAKKWYPVIDILTCVECGTCVEFCPHGVYDKQKAPVPVVVNPDSCIDHCHGCQKKCPSGAISYVGDTWRLYGKETGVLLLWRMKTWKNRDHLSLKS